MGKTELAKTERVLIYRLGSLGDTIVALPCFHLIARAFPAAERRLLTNFPIHAKAPPAAAILESTGLVQGYFRYAVGTRSPRELLRLWAQLLRWRPQVLVYLGAARGVSSARRDALFFRLCGIRTQIGVPLTDDLQQNRLYPAESHPAEAEAYEEYEEYEVCRLGRTLTALGDARLDDPTSWDLRLTGAEHAKAAERLTPISARPLIAVSIGTKNQSNEWEDPNWRALMARLAVLYPDHGLVLTGAAVDRDPSESLARAWRDAGTAAPALNLCGDLTPRQSAAVFSRCRIFLGQDSGPMHLAAAAQIPCVAIFSARGKPRKWFPFGSHHHVLYHRVECWGCGLETCTIQKKKCILSITPEEVLARVAEVFAARPTPMPDAMPDAMIEPQNSARSGTPHVA